MKLPAFFRLAHSPRSTVDEKRDPPLGEPLTIKDTTFIVAERDGALLGYLSCTVDGQLIEGIALRRMSDGRLMYSFPAEADRLVQSLSQELRREIVRQGIAAVWGLDVAS